MKNVIEKFIKTKMKAIKGKCKELTPKFNWMTTTVVSALVGLIVAAIIVSIIQLFEPKEMKEITRETVTISLTTPYFGVTPNDSISDREAIQNLINVTKVIAKSNPHVDFVFSVPAGLYILDKKMNGEDLSFYMQSQATFRMQGPFELHNFKIFITDTPIQIRSGVSGDFSNSNIEKDTFSYRWWN